ncbi:hypothetical protein L6452_20860 [Arctium lappa]|uniref:Uncharacterized protein n=1 Tax=Arctium lappa TaxID=4217 RepID=A0ACB9BBQ5_ARCLA|nr:hypothetical protein L6452_20860 [Arctium lappa]
MNDPFWEASILCFIYNMILAWRKLFNDQLQTLTQFVMEWGYEDGKRMHLGHNKHPHYDTKLSYINHHHSLWHCDNKDLPLTLIATFDDGSKEIGHAIAGDRKQRNN